MTLNVLGLVPARGGSLRIPDKNLAELGGRTLVQTALKTCTAARRLSAVALSSDDKRILGEGANVDGVICLRRPAELSTPTATSHAAVMHALAEVERTGHRRFDAVALVQCSSPFTLPADVDATIEVLERNDAGSAFSVMRLEHAYHPEKVRILAGERLVPYADVLEPRAAHEVDALWINNGSVYVTRRETLEAGSLASPDLCGYVMPPERSLDINAPRDLEFARFLHDRHPDSYRRRHDSRPGSP